MKASRRIIFVSGFAGYPWLFPGLAERAAFFVPFIQPPDEIAAAIKAASETEAGGILVGWSSGAHILLKSAAPVFARFDRVLLLAPFACFTDHVPAAEVAALAARIKRSPAAALRPFYRAMGYAGPVTPPPAGDVPLLLAGLDFLMTSRACPGKLPGNVRIVHGERDAVVPAEAGRAIAAATGADWRTAPHGHYFPPADLNALIA